MAFSPAPFAQQLVAWFNRSQRDLRWRQAHNATDPYRILVSEVMLQQTTVAAVGPFYERFLTRFPDVRALAEAPEEDVLKQWAGLGYYARARNLHRAARAIVEEHHGEFPRELNGILALPGVGRYTAGAVSSIAFNARSPIVDANVARVLSRVLAIEGDLKTARTQEKLWEAATQIVEVESVEPREVNPAMMELGALVCTPKTPRCPACPVSDGCAAKAQNRQNELPFTAPKKAPTPMFDVCALAVDESNRVLLRRRADDPKIWWSGMWELPRATRTQDESSSEALLRLSRELRVQWKPESLAARVKHGVTRYAIELECWRVGVQCAQERDDLKWASPEQARDLAMPSMMRRLFERFTPSSTESEQLRLL
jgi:A/G-specific adenine glycosylase